MSYTNPHEISHEGWVGEPISERGLKEQCQVDKACGVAILMWASEKLDKEARKNLLEHAG
jgi:hypothetical protein